MTLPSSVPLCFVDTETTGLHLERIPWEIGVIRRDPDGSEFEWRAFLDVDLSKAERPGLKVGRFYERHPVGRWLSGLDGKLDDVEGGHSIRVDALFNDATISQEEAAYRFARLTHGAHIIGAGPWFDTETMDPPLGEAGLISAFHYGLIDIKTLIVGFLAGRGEPLSPPWRTDDLFAAVGVTTPDAERHTALGDARAVQRAYDAVMVGGPL